MIYCKTESTIFFCSQLAVAPAADHLHTFHPLDIVRHRQAHQCPSSLQVNCILIKNDWNDEIILKLLIEKSSILCRNKCIYLLFSNQSFDPSTYHRQSKVFQRAKFNLPSLWWKNRTDEKNNFNFFRSLCQNG